MAADLLGYHWKIVALVLYNRSCRALVFS